jgi:hypothetical protein
MADAKPSRVPTMRISRPYGSEDELIDGDFASLARAWIILPDAPVYPVGELVRFEVLLSSGAPAIRGEGTVTAYHAPGGPKPPGLEVKFSRIDARTKSILQRVHAKRNALGHSVSLPPGLAISAETPAPPLARAEAPTPPVCTDSGSTGPDLPKEDLSDVRAARAPGRNAAPPPNRNEILDRLRDRARALPPDKRFERSRGA